MEMWNILNDIYNGSYHITTDLTFYGTNKEYPDPQAADVVVPISSATDGQAWFSVSSDSDFGSTNVTLPTNIRAAYLEVYASGQSNDEFWYSNPPTDYSNEINATGIGNGPFREVLAYFDGRLIGSTVPHLLEAHLLYLPLGSISHLLLPGWWMASLTNLVYR
jgi:hypothetical protein